MADPEGRCTRPTATGRKPGQRLSKDSPPLEQEGKASIYHPYRWCGDGKLSETKGWIPETEKITTNLGLVDLGQIDLLVREGFYSNRTDFIRAAIRSQLDRQADAVKQLVSRRRLQLGLHRFGRADLEAVRAAGETLDIQVLGLAVIAPDVSPDLARATIASLQVLGALQASAEVKAALRDRMS